MVCCLCYDEKEQWTCFCLWSISCCSLLRTMSCHTHDPQLSLSWRLWVEGKLEGGMTLFKVTVYSRVDFTVLLSHVLRLKIFETENKDAELVGGQKNRCQIVIKKYNNNKMKMSCFSFLLVFNVQYYHLRWSTIKSSCFCFLIFAKWIRKVSFQSKFFWLPPSPP